MEKTGTVEVGRQSWKARLAQSVPYIVILLVLLIIPPILSDYSLSMLTKVLIFGVFAMSLDLVMGFTGLLSLGHAAYLGVGGYALGILMVHYGVTSFWILFPASVLIAAIFAAVIGYMALRVTGVYFLLITLAFAQLLSTIAAKWFAMTGGTSGLIDIRLPDTGIPFFSWNPYTLYYFIFIAFVVCYILLYIITNSHFGKALVGVRENKRRMKSLGYNTWAYKYIAFIIGGFFAGIAGALFAPFYGAMAPGYLGLLTSASVMLMVVIGGPGTLFGPVIGALFIVLLEHYASIYSPERWPLILGIVFILCVLFVRGGFAIYFVKYWRKVKSRVWLS